MNAVKGSSKGFDKSPTKKTSTKRGTHKIGNQPFLFPNQKNKCVQSHPQQKISSPLVSLKASTDSNSTGLKRCPWAWYQLTVLIGESKTSSRCAYRLPSHGRPVSFRRNLPIFGGSMFKSGSVYWLPLYSAILINFLEATNESTQENCQNFDIWSHQGIHTMPAQSLSETNSGPHSKVIFDLGGISLKNSRIGPL